jgi:hypothetical protein
MTKRRTTLTMGEQLARLEQLIEPLFEGKSDEEQEALAEELVEEFGEEPRPQVGASSKEKATEPPPTIGWSILAFSRNALDVISQATGGVPVRRPERRDR